MKRHVRNHSQQKGADRSTHRVDGNDRVDLACLHEQRLQRVRLTVFTSINQSKQLLVRVRERGRRQAEERVRDLCCVEVEAVLRECRLESSDYRADTRRVEGSGLPTIL